MARSPGDPKFPSGKPAASYGGGADTPNPTLKAQGHAVATCGIEQITAAETERITRIFFVACQEDGNARIFQSSNHLQRF